MHTARRSLLAVMAMAGGLVALGSSAPAPAAETVRVLMVDNEPDLTNWHYEPAEVTVPAGATVVWFNKGKHEHTVTADDKSFDSGMKRSGASWQRAFPKAGRYTYYCVPHPWMKGTVRVVAAAQAPATSTTVTTAAPPTTAPRTAAGSGQGATTTTFPASLGAQRSDAPAATQTTAATESTAAPPASAPPADPPGSDDAVATPASSNRGGSGGKLLGSTAVVLLPTLAALALGARLRRRSEEPAEA